MMQHHVEDWGWIDRYLNLQAESSVAYHRDSRPQMPAIPQA